MKKIIFFLIVAGSFMTTQLYSQANLGLRIGGWSGLGAEISFQNKLRNGERLEFDAGFGAGGGTTNSFEFSLVGIYQWTFSFENGLGWYVGPGASFGFYYYELAIEDYDKFYMAINGQVGLEYNFQFPIQLSIDYRPGISLNGGDWINNYGIGVRWRFGG